MSGKRIRIFALASSQPTDAAGMWVQNYDPDGNDGRGDLLLTDDRSKAKVYPDAAEAWKEWGRTSSTHPLRADGRPNRPMTAFSVVIE